MKQIQKTNLIDSKIMTLGSDINWLHEQRQAFLLWRFLSPAGFW